MLKKALSFLTIVFCIMLLAVLSVSAECQHNFSPMTDKSNLITNDGFTHSYHCIYGCGITGTVDGGINGKEKCSLSLVYDKTPTCVSEGKKVYACNVCFRNKVEVQKKTGHSYSKIRKLPTCTQQGYDLYVCTVCGESYKDNVIQQLNHFSDGGIIVVEPTYNSEGLINFSCRICNTVLSKKAVSPFVKQGESETRIEKVSRIKFENITSSSVRVSWDDNDKAESYIILYSADKKKWKSLSAEKTYVNIKKLKSAHTYYFKAVAVAGNWESEESGIFSVCTAPERAVLKSAKSSNKTEAVISWKKLKGVSGYEISYTAKDFKDTKTVKAVKVTKGLKKKLKKLKSGKKYRFRVRGYKNSVYGKIYGAYSKVKILKIK